MRDRMVDWEGTDPLDRTVFRGAEPERRTRRGPHEAGQAGRRVQFYMPGPEWKAAVAEVVEEWDVRPCDVYVYAVACLMKAIEEGLERPVNGGLRFWHRAGECMELPWEP